MTVLPYLPAAELAARPEEQRWLIEGLWADQAVGIVGGEPKSFKSFLALDMSVAVASGAPFLRRYPVRSPGTVLLFAAEDALHVVRQRLDGICSAAGLPLASLDIQVVTAPSLRLDLQGDRQRLEQTVASLQPRMLLLDPFVRLHRIDENTSGEVAPLLAFLRQLQRSYGVAVVVVHHARKGAAHQRAGQALRGSSEFHAWGDSNLYLRRAEQGLLLTIEHRAAPSPDKPLLLQLQQVGPALALRVLEEQSQSEKPPSSPSIDERITAILTEAANPLPLKELRSRCQIRMATLCHALNQLTDDQRVVKTAAGYSLPADP